MPKKEKYLLRASIALAAVFAVAPASNAMHIMEGYLPAGYCVAWGLICLPFLIAGFFSLKNKVKENRRNLMLIAMSGAFIFVISSLKIPSVTGSCSHMTGTGLGAVLFGPASVSILGIIVLIFQAVLSGTRRSDHTGSQYIFHGHSRAAGVFRNLQTLSEDKDKQKSRNLSGSVSGRSVYLLCNQHPACPGLSVRSRRRGGFCGEVPWRVRAPRSFRWLSLRGF